MSTNDLYQIQTLTPSAILPGYRELLLPKDAGYRSKTVILSSHLGKSAIPPAAWLDRLRWIVEESRRQDHLLLNARGVSVYRFLQGVGTLAAADVLEIHLPHGRSDERHWRRETQRRRKHSADASSNDSAHDAFLSPPLSLPASPTPAGRCQVDRRFAILPEPQSSRFTELPYADRALLLLADIVYVLAVRVGGKIHQLLDLVFSQNIFRGCRVMLAQGQDAVPDSLAQNWFSQGAIGWYLLGAGKGEPGPPAKDLAWCCDQAGAPANLRTWMPSIPLPNDPTRYLFHWTRCQPGPWPDQTNAEFVRDLLWCPERRDHSAAAALRRILTRHRVVATSRLLPTSTPAVCFTARPLDDFTSARVFRPHQQRWDFEHYGIGVDRQWLSRQGARAVRYVDRGNQSDLEFAGPFDQPAVSRYGSVDWRAEQEWRLPGDLDLRRIPDRSAVVFVPDAREVARFARYSRWPIVAVDGS